MEHRWGHRVTVGIDVRLACRPSAIGTGRLRDVSVSGAFIETSLQPPLLAHVRMRIENPGDTRPAFEAAGHVVRWGPSGIGIEWCALAPSCVSELRELALRQHSARAPREAARV